MSSDPDETDPTRESPAGTGPPSPASPHGYPTEPEESRPRPYVRLMAAVGGVGAVALVVAAVLGATTEPAVPQTDMPPPASLIPTELLPSGMTGVPLPSGYPSDWLTGVPTEWPTSWPTGYPSLPSPTYSFPSLPELPTDYQDLPSDWPSLDLPQDGDAP